MTAIINTAKQNVDILKTLKLHIGMGLEQNNTEDKTLDIQIRIAEIDAEFKSMLKSISSDSIENFDESKATELMNEKADWNSSSLNMPMHSRKEKMQNPALMKYIRYSTDSKIICLPTMTKSFGRYLNAW